MLAPVIESELAPDLVWELAPVLVWELASPAGEERQKLAESRTGGAAVVCSAVGEIGSCKVGRRE